MTTKCFAPIFGKRIRVSKMDVDCKRVLAGDCAEIVTDGFVSLSLSSEVEDGAEITVKKASGAICISHKSPDSFKRFTLEMEFCGVDPDLLSFMTNMTAYADAGGDVIGATVYEGAVDQKFGLEVWTGLANYEASAGDVEASGWVALPCINAGVLGDISVDGENAVTFTMTGAYTVSGNQWGVGGHPVIFNGATPPVASLLPEALLPTEPMIILQTGVAPPPVACGCGPSTAAGATP